MPATTLADLWSAYVDEAAIAARTTSPQVQARRDFMAGAMAYHELRSSGATTEALLAELLGFGRALGSEAERAVG